MADPRLFQVRPLRVSNPHPIAAEATIRTSEEGEREAVPGLVTYRTNTYYRLLSGGSLYGAGFLPLLSSSWLESPNTRFSHRLVPCL